MSATFEKVISASHVFNEEIECLYDENAQLFVLIEQNGNILAVLDYHIEKEVVARVQQSASLQSHMGYGYTIYLYALATLSKNLMICADTADLTPGALALWKSLFNAATDNDAAWSQANSSEKAAYECALLKHSLLDTPLYRRSVDEGFDEAIFITNPDLFIRDLDTFDASEDIEAGQLNPNLPNWGFSMNGKVCDRIFARVFRKNFTPVQKRVIYDYLTCAYQLRHCRFTIPMRLPRSSQTTLAQ
tara:strand:- start:16643 stop:17380 length:738 start_codon:yes stop_codon:yes gene_type:complete